MVGALPTFQAPVELLSVVFLVVGEDDESRSNRINDGCVTGDCDSGTRPAALLPGVLLAAELILCFLSPGGPVATPWHGFDHVSCVTTTAAAVALTF